MPRPDFFIVGAPKCGTSAMAEFLRRHPRIAVCAKEVYYFGSDLGFESHPRTESEYLSRFGRAGESEHVGEQSVFHLFSIRAAEEIKTFAPHARIIAMLRDPVEMIHSLHSQLLFVGGENIADFKLAIEADGERARSLRPPRHPVIRRHGYIPVGRYSQQLERYFDAFGRGRVHTVIHEDFRADPAGTYAEVCQFLGVDPTVQPSFGVVNANKRARSHVLQRTMQHPPPVVHRIGRALSTPALRREVASLARRLNTDYTPRAPMPVAARRRLAVALAPDVARLGELLERDLSGWCRGDPVTTA